MYLCLSLEAEGESSPIVICGVLTVVDLEEDLLPDTPPLPGRLDLLIIIGPEKKSKQKPREINLYNE